MRFRTFAVTFLAFLVMTGAAFAQTGSITGQIFDPAGAVVPNATITATSNTTGVTRTVTSSSAGLYSLAALPPSVYTIVVTASGFQPQTRTDVTLNIAATLSLNINLAIAGSATTVEVQDITQAPIETDSFALSTVIDSKQINELLS
jgi:hypothetical protein